MREIKFRGVVKGIDTPKKRWAYGYYYQVGGKHYIILDDALIEEGEYGMSCGIIGFVEVHPETVGQFTGLHDKNGKEGCRDDIALCSDGEYGLVVWKDAGWYLKKRSKSHTEEYYSYIDLSYCIGTLEFVGDVHSKPELLKD